MAPLRDGPALAAAVKRTVPLPLPLPPESSTLVLVDERENAHPSPWLSVKVRPAMVNEPLRAGPVAAGALYCTSPLPLPPDPAVMVSHEVLLDAVQLQPAPVVTATLPVVAPAGTFAFSGEIA